MAKRRSGRYRMTPKRRAALKRAQMISARKRRNQKWKSGALRVGRTAGAIGVAVGGTFVAYHANRHLNRWIRHPSQAPKDIKKGTNHVTQFVKSTVHKVVS